MEIHIVQFSANGFPEDPEPYAHRPDALDRLRRYHAEGLTRDGDGAEVPAGELESFEGAVLTSPCGTREARLYTAAVIGVRSRPPQVHVHQRDAPEAERRQAADAALAEHDFGEESVEATDGWQWSTGGDEWRCAAYLAGRPGGESRRVTVTVRFRARTAEVAEVTADP